jgi:hypothetical protein
MVFPDWFYGYRIVVLELDSYKVPNGFQADGFYSLSFRFNGSSLT